MEKKYRRKVFIDCGGHHGESVRKFLKYYPDAKNFEIHSFEPNPNNKVFFEDLPNHQFHNKAVWIEDTTLKFYGMEEKHRDEGYTIMLEKNDISKEQYIEVAAVDFSFWLSTNFSEKDYIIVKLDIEGAEYDVLQKLFEDEAITLVDKLYAEFHYQWMNIDIEKHDRVMNELLERGLKPLYWDAISPVFFPGYPSLTKIAYPLHKVFAKAKGGFNKILSR